VHDLGGDATDIQSDGEPDHHRGGAPERAELRVAGERSLQRVQEDPHQRQGEHHPDGERHQVRVVEKACDKDARENERRQREQRPGEPAEDVRPGKHRTGYRGPRQAALQAPFQQLAHAPRNADAKSDREELPCQRAAQVRCVPQVLEKTTQQVVGGCGTYDHRLA
jgi:hypothetical protein